MGAINTAVLIFSSLTAAWAVRCAQLNQQKRPDRAASRSRSRARCGVPRHQVHRVHAQDPRAHPVRPLLRSVRQLGRRRRCSRRTTSARAQVDRGVGHGDGARDRRLLRSDDRPGSAQADGVQADCKVARGARSPPATHDGKAGREQGSREQSPTVRRAGGRRRAGRCRRAGGGEGQAHGRGQAVPVLAAAERRPQVCKRGWLSRGTAPASTCTRPRREVRTPTRASARTRATPRTAGKRKARVGSAVVHATATAVGILVEYGDHEDARPRHPDQGRVQAAAEAGRRRSTRSPTSRSTLELGKRR